MVEAFTRAAGPEVELLGFEPFASGLCFRVRVRGEEGPARRIQVYRDRRDVTADELAREAGTGARVWAKARMQKHDAQRIQGKGPFG